MNPLLKLGFTDTFEGAKNYFTHVLSKRYNVIRDDENPDYLIFGDRNFGFSNERFNNRNVIKIFYTGENQRPHTYKSHFSISFDHIDDEKNFRLPLYVLYEFDHHLIGRHTKNWTDISTLNKKGFCSFIQKNPNCTKRNWYFNELSKYKKVDAGGSLFHNIPDPFPDGSGEKTDFMSKYKFSLCFENSSYPGYLTEKLFESLCSKTIPIYWGSPTAAMDFNPKAFINWHDYQNDEAFIKAIIELDQNEDNYIDMYMQPMFNNSEAKNKYFDDKLLLDWFDRNVYKGVLNV